METENIIELNNVSISHQDGLVLSGVTFSLKRGEFVYLIGKSGAGKTSLLRSLYADKTIDTGTAMVCGMDLTAIRKRQIPLLRRKIGVVFQNFRLLTDRSVYENLNFVLRATGWKKRDEIDQQIMQTLQSVGIADKADAMTYRLSEGEQQRVGIARALINNPDLILADEPTGNLDPETASNIVALLREITQKGTAVIMSTHNIPMLDKYPGKVYECKEGRFERCLF